MRKFARYICLHFSWIILPACVFAQGGYDNFIDAAKLSFRNGNYLESAQLYSKAFASNHNLGRIDHRYMAARSWALTGNMDSALYQVEKIAGGGYRSFLEIYNDTAFYAFRDNSKWQKVLNIIRSNQQRMNERDIKSLSRPYSTLAARLDSIRTKDQIYRYQLPWIEKQFGRRSPQMDSIYTLIRKQDSENVLLITEILDTYGWLGEKEIGSQGNQTLFLVVQHADLSTQKKYLPLLRQAVKTGKAPPSEPALLEDRIAMRQDQKQTYGSQIGINDKTGQYYVLPVIDPENINKRRAEVGLQSIEEYVATWGIKWSVSNYTEALKSRNK